MTLSVRRDRAAGWVTIGQQRFPFRRPEDVRDSLTQGMCPFCGHGPFVMVAGHVASMHHVNRDELRLYAGVALSASICDPTLSAVIRQRLRRRPDNVVRLSAGTTSNSRAKAAQTMHLSHSARHRYRDADVVAAFHGGELQQEIAARLGITPHTVRRILRRNGIATDGRSSKQSRERHAAVNRARGRMSRTCANPKCGATFVGYNKTCSKACARQRQSDVAKETRARHTTRSVELVCPACQCSFVVTEAYLRRQRKSGYADPCCSRSCASRAAMARRKDAE